MLIVNYAIKGHSFASRVWVIQRTVGLTVEIKLRFCDGLVWAIGLTVEIKLRSPDGLVWTAGLTVEIKLRFPDGLVRTVGLTVEIDSAFLNFYGIVARCLRRFFYFITGTELLNWIKEKCKMMQCLQY